MFLRKAAGVFAGTSAGHSFKIRIFAIRKYNEIINITQIMVKHIVLFKLKETLSPAEKSDVMRRFKAAVESLPERIACIRSIYVGLNANPAEEWDICLEGVFDSLGDVKAYAVHPDHLAAAAILKDAKCGRACADYEC